MSGHMEIATSSQKQNTDTKLSGEVFVENNTAKASRTHGSYFSAFSAWIAILHGNATALHAGLEHMQALGKQSEAYEALLVKLQTQASSLPTVAGNSNSSKTADAQEGYLQSLTVKTHVLDNAIENNGSNESQTMTSTGALEQENLATAGNANAEVKLLNQAYSPA